MVLSHNRVLYSELFSKIARMHEEVDYRRHLNAYQGQGGKRKDYPCVSVGAELNLELAVGHHHYYSTSFDFHPLLFQEMTARLGPLNEYGANYPACRNRVGHCAEDYAATSVMTKNDPQGHFTDARVLNQIQFTNAFRPRTWKFIEWCENCHTMFD